MENSRDPSGILREHASDIAFKNLESTWSDEERLNFLRKSIAYCVSNGITAVQTNDGNCWKLYKTLTDLGELPIRIFLTINYKETCVSNDEQKVSIPTPQEKYGKVGLTNMLFSRSFACISF